MMDTRWGVVTSEVDTRQYEELPGTDYVFGWVIGIRISSHPLMSLKEDNECPCADEYTCIYDYGMFPFCDTSQPYPID